MLFLTARVKRDFLDTCARIETGALRLRTPEGEVYDFGRGQPAAEMRIKDWSVVTSIASRGDVGLGETYVAGLWDTPSIDTLAEVALKNYERFAGYAYAGFWNRLKFRTIDRLMRANSPRGAARNIRAHYDVGNEFYQLWLDEGGNSIHYVGAPGPQGEMVLMGDKVLPDGTRLKSRMRLAPEPEGVHQLIELSPDGRRWQPWFEASYRRR